MNSKKKGDRLERDTAKFFNELCGIQDSKIILSFIFRRLELIKELEILTEKHSDELHQLQPIFKSLLWIF